MAGPGDTYYGTVYIREFDLGVISTIGGELIEILRDGEAARAYVLDPEHHSALGSMRCEGPDEFDQKIPIMFGTPEGAYEKEFFPSVVIRPGDPQPDWIRWEPGGTAYKLPADGAKEVSVTINTQGDVVNGFDRYEVRGKEVPHNLPYDIELRARKRWQKVAMLHHVQKKLYDRALFLTDTAGNERSYDLQWEGFSSADEFAEVADRTLAYIVSILVVGGLDIRDPVVYPSVRERVINQSLM